MTSPVKVRCLIVDDEPLAREKLRGMLKKHPEVEIIGECANGKEAVATIQKETPDLLFLDIQMPEMDGFGVLKAISADKLPRVIFVTAYDKYALRAFEVFALDYLLKPFDRERFDKALQRARLEIQRDRGGDTNQRILALLEEIKHKPKHLERIVIKSNGRIFFLKSEESDWIEAEGNYVRIHTGKESYLIRETITSLENQLNPKRFLRIHRSTIVNIDRIKELQPWFHGDYRILLKDGTQLTMSRSYREKLHELLGKPY
jgi:two-component system, LytTR family, response regulator